MEVMTSLRILIDNTPDTDGRLHSEHGLSIYMEACGKKFLIDTGLSGKAMDNARALGADISQVDFLILSHGHKDHTGGLWRFLEENKSAKIIASRKIAELDYTSDSRGIRHSLNPDKDLIMKNKDRFIFLDRNLMEVRDGENQVSAGTCDTDAYERPRGNRLLHINGLPYNGDDELIITVVADGRMTVISPCSHSGLMNIIRCAEKRTGMECSTFVGGLHMIDGEGDLDSAGPSIRESIRHTIKKMHTGHCTGKTAQERLRAMAGVEVFRTGDVIYC